MIEQHVMKYYKFFHSFAENRFATYIVLHIDTQNTDKKLAFCFIKGFRNFFVWLNNTKRGAAKEATTK